MGIIYNESSVNLSCHTSDWMIDSGVSFRVTAHRDYFTLYVNGDYGYVRIGNEGASKINGTGDSYLKTSIGCKLLLKDVRHVSNIHLNLTFTGKFDDDGCTNEFDEGKWKLTKGSLVLAKRKKLNTRE